MSDPPPNIPVPEPSPFHTSVPLNQNSHWDHLQKQLSAYGPDPYSLWCFFFLCLETPRPSGKESIIRQRIIQIAHLYDCTHSIDTAGNLVVHKPARKAEYAAHPVICLQAHLDVVTTKSHDKIHDFTRDPILPTLHDDGWLRADRTTLGADNGIGIAAILALLEAERLGELQCGALEFLFTVEEESTMRGAVELAGPPFLDARSSLLINVDSEEDGHICAGCAGGFKADLQWFPRKEEVETVHCDTTDFRTLQVTISGGLGGHSGLDINKGHANCILLLANLLEEYLSTTPVGARLMSAEGGNATNAIPSGASATFLMPSEQAARMFEQKLEDAFHSLAREWDDVEKNLRLQVQISPMSAAASSQVKVLSEVDTLHLTQVLLQMPHGPIKTNADLGGSVETSICFSMLRFLADGKDEAPPSASLHVFARSSSDAQLKQVERKLLSFARITPQIELKSDKVHSRFPSWKPDVHSLAIQTLKQTHARLFAKPAIVHSVHAGLESPFFARSYPKLECVSIGPMIVEAHTPQERLKVDTVLPFFRWMIEIINQLCRSESDSKSTHSSSQGIVAAASSSSEVLPQALTRCLDQDSQIGP